MLHEHAKGLTLPAYMSDLASGMDIAAAIKTDMEIEPGDIVLIPTGLSVSIPEGYELQVRPRSGMAIKHGLTVVNAPGTIDADYRGEIKVGLVNLGKETVRVRRGDRIAQIVLCEVFNVKWEKTNELDITNRGGGGFGHSGIK